ncbi:uncharacterized protein LOC111864639 isoform X2 [Cryptotermes secundus]|nr:uncharacterized protein LOC111864639 isoform X2 [Cryptotermes secundus]
MNRRKAPTGLRDVAYSRINEMVREAGVKWTRRLRSAAVTSRRIWLQEIESVVEECILVRAQLASLPLILVTEYINGYGIGEFTKIIASYDCDNGRPRIARIFERRVHQDTCLNILKTVMFPCITTCDVSKMDSKFVQKLFINLLYVIPNVEVLILPRARHLNYTQLLLRRIMLLSRLREFHFHLGCTREIIIQLSEHCPRLNNLSVKDSKRVNDKCVRHLLKLRGLLILEITGTSVSSNGYEGILSGLPEIQNVLWYPPIDPILRSLEAPLHSVKTFTGNTSDAQLLVQKCPNLTELTLITIPEETSDLGALRSVATLCIYWCTSTAIRFSNVIIHLGPNLTVLKLGHVGEITINDLINSCTVLNSLTMSYCNIDHTGFLDPALPHFRNLRKLALGNNRGPFDFSSILPLYINLNALRLMFMGEITDTFMRQTVTAGGFRNLSECFIEFCGDMSMDTAWLLLQNCPNLTKIGSIGTWSRVYEDQVVTFLNSVMNFNFSLDVLR